MSDYIKRESRTFIEIADDLNDLLTELNDKIVESIWAKTADVAPIRHGRWIETSYDEYKCSVCEKIVREDILYAIKPSDREEASMHVANYCPNCGAKMDEEEKHGQR